ncbi:MAG: hypothetical protein ACK4VY_07985 [Brevundimonas sp.]
MSEITTDVGQSRLDRRHTLGQIVHEKIQRIDLAVDPAKIDQNQVVGFINH